MSHVLPGDLVRPAGDRVRRGLPKLDWLGLVITVVPGEKLESDQPDGAILYHVTVLWSPNLIIETWFCFNVERA